MKNLLQWLAQCDHPFDPAAWSRAVLGFGLTLVFLWLSLGLRLVWHEAPAPASVRTATPAIGDEAVATHVLPSQAVPTQPPLAF